MARPGGAAPPPPPADPVAAGPSDAALAASIKGVPVWSGSDQYQWSSRGLLWWRGGKTDGAAPVVLTNVGIRIIREYVCDEGLPDDDGLPARRYVLEITPGDDPLIRVTVPFTDLERPGRVLAGACGADARVVWLGPRADSRVVDAIAAVSSPHPNERRFIHTGWHHLPGGWAYLHAGGAITASGLVTTVLTELAPELAHAVLPDPPTGPDAAAALRLLAWHSLSVSHPGVTVPLWGSVWRTVLPVAPPPFATALVGPTGAGKTTLALLAQSCWGAAFLDRPPVSASATANFVEGILFYAKNMAVVTDDFTFPSDQRLYAAQRATFERAVRATGNQVGRGRAAPHGGTVPSRPPRGLALITAEGFPADASLVARLCFIELGAHATNWEAVTLLQARARSGALAAGLSVFLRWLADHVELAQSELTTQLERARAAGSSAHGRLVDLEGHLRAGWRLLLLAATDVGALNVVEATTLVARQVDAGLATQRHEAGRVARAADPTRLFINALREAVSRGAAYLEGEGQPIPPVPASHGWREEQTGREAVWRPQGHALGCILAATGEWAVLPTEAYQLARTHLEGTGQILPMPGALWKQLAERALSRAETDKEGWHLGPKVRWKADRKRMLVLRADALEGSAHVAPAPTPGDQLSIADGFEDEPPWSGPEN